MLTTISNFLSLVRFSHTLFALPFALLAAAMAWRLRMIEEFGGSKLFELPEVGAIYDTNLSVGNASFSLDWLLESQFDIRWPELLGILLCMVTARTTAMAFNRLVDRRIDAENPRTAGRHLPAGILSVTQVNALTIACGFAFVASTLMFLPNRLPLYLSVPVLAFLCGYSYAKCFTSYAHFWLGAALAMSPVAVWIAIRGEVVLEYPADLLPSLVLGTAVLTWVAGFDIIYACQDFGFDKQQGLHSVPARRGIAGALRIAAGCHLLTVVALACLPLVYEPFGWLYWLAVVAVAVLLIYEHALVRPDDLDRVNTAFFNVNAVISLGLLAVGTLDLWLGAG